MGGKKKGGGGKKKGGPAVAEEDDSVEKFFRQYRKRCTEYDVPKDRNIMDKLDAFTDE